MSAALLAAILDTLLPGDDGAGAAGALPPGSQAGIDLAALDSIARPVVDAIDAARFETATAAERAAILASMERSASEAYRNFLGRVLAAYYQAPGVLAAFGWRSEPPQPRGHPLPAEESTLQLLEKVRKRGQLWRV